MQDEPNPAPAVIGYPAWENPLCPQQEKIAREPYNKTFIDQACSIKMAERCTQFLQAKNHTPVSERSKEVYMNEKRR